MPEVKARAELPSPIELKERLDELEVMFQEEIERVRMEAAEEYVANLADLRAELTAEIPRILRDFKAEVVDQFRREVGVLLNGENAEEAVAEVTPVDDAAYIARERLYDYIVHGANTPHRFWDGLEGGNGNE